MRAVILAALMASPAAAQQQCGPHADLTNHLAEQFGESRQAIALDRAQRVMEVYASTATGTWTIVVTIPGGQTCIAAFGTDFQRTDADPAPQGEQM